jgi:hypothetical protein
MLKIIAVILFVSWLMGLLTYNIDGFIHVLLVVAIVVIPMRFIRASSPS